MKRNHAAPSDTTTTQLRCAITWLIGSTWRHEEVWVDVSDVAGTIWTKRVAAKKRARELAREIHPDWAETCLRLGAHVMRPDETLVPDDEVIWAF